MIYIYEFYLNNPESKHFVKDAKRIYSEYFPASTLLSEKINRAVNNLFSFAYPNQSQKFRRLTDDEIKDLISELKNLLRQEFNED